MDENGNSREGEGWGTIFHNVILNINTISRILLVYECKCCNLIG